MVKFMLIYLIIFSLKLLENTLSTLRTIILSNHSKILSSILVGIVSLIWVVSVSLSIYHIEEDPIKIIVFAIGSMFGSYLGSILEEKISLGFNFILCITKLEPARFHLSQYYFEYYDYLKDSFILCIPIKRKENKTLISYLLTIDSASIILTFTSDLLHGSLVDYP
jgi:uncharacterized protein YebE (UPF0316 family)